MSVFFSASQGDSGGPLIKQEGPDAGEQVGLTSYGAAAGCEVGYPDAFTSVFKFKDWIDDNINNID